MFKKKKKKQILYCHYNANVFSLRCQDIIAISTVSEDSLQIKSSV